MSAISFIQWFGNQGALKGLLGGVSVYGPLGIILSSIYATFPHALMIVLTALLLADGRLYEAAESLRTPRWRKFFTITLPGAQYGLVSATMVVFSYTVSDFGIPKVIGGNFNVLAVDIFKQVIGQQNFNKGAVVGLILLRAGAARVHRRLDHAGHASRRSSRRAPCPMRRSREPWFDRAMLALLHRRGAAPARGARHGDLHVVHQVLAVRQVDEPAPLHVRPGRRAASSSRSSTASGWRS